MMIYNVVGTQVKLFLSLTERESWDVAEGEEQFQETQFSLDGLGNSYTYTDSVSLMIWCLQIRRIYFFLNILKK